jgi:hypothetical protein
MPFLPLVVVRYPTRAGWNAVAIGSLGVSGSLLMTSCGGPSSNSPPSPFAGFYAGVSLVTAADSGTTLRIPRDLSIAVDAHGRITGQWGDSHGCGTLSGSVNPRGTITVTLLSSANEEATLTARGPTALSPNGRWYGRVAVTTPAVAGVQLVWALQRP